MVNDWRQWKSEWKEQIPELGIKSNGGKKEKIFVNLPSVRIKRIKCFFLNVSKERKAVYMTYE